MIKRASAIRAAAIASALLAADCLGAPAWAQGGSGEEARQGTMTPPGERLAVTSSGVNMRSGQYAYTATDLSIGEDSETGGIAFTRTMNALVLGHENPFANFSHNWDIMITELHPDLDQGEYDILNGPDFRIAVRFGGRSETFDSRAEESVFSQSSNNPMTRLTYSGTRAGASVIYTYTANDGTVAEFRALGNGDCSGALRCAYVSQITHPDGTRFSFEYDPGIGPTRLRAVTSNRGYALLLQYGSGSDANHVTSACVINLAVQAKPSNNSCPSTPQGATSYTYTSFESNRRLATAVDAGGATSSFTYARVAGVLKMGFLRPGDTSAWLTNSITERTSSEGPVELVSSQLFADSSTWNFNYTFAPQVEGEIAQVAGGAYQDPAGNWTEIEYGFPPRPGPYGPQPVNVGDLIYQITPAPVRISDSLGRVTTSDYCDRAIWAALAGQNRRCVVTLLQSFTDPEGHVTELTYDGTQTRNVTLIRRKAAVGSGLADIVTSATYDCTYAVNCAKPTSRTDANGNVTTYSYDTAHGGPRTETGPAVGGIHPQVRYAYAQRYAWISNGAGGYVQASTPIWVRTETSTCRTSAATGNPAAPCAAGALDEVRTLYDYGPDSGPNTLLLRGQSVIAEAQGQLETHRTCYGYDARGRRISETQPNANLGSCP